MDYLWNRKSSRCNEGDEKTTVLLAPSWGSSSILNRFGAKIIDCLISTGYYIIIRPHPQSFISEKEMILELMEQYPETDLLKWNLDSDNFEVLQNASILISDYSGILYDYAFVFDRPVIYTDVSLDLTCTDHAFLEEELWIYPVLRKIGKELKEIEIPKIKSFIDSLINSKEMQKYISEARESCWQYRGLAAERVVDYLLKKDEELKEAGGVDDKG